MGRHANTDKNNTRSLILKAVLHAGQISRKDVAQIVGITPAAVTMVTADLVKEGILVEKGFDFSDGRTGRKKVLMSVNEQYRYVFTLSIDPVRVVCAISDIAGNLKQKMVFPVDRKAEPEKLLKTAAGILRSMQSELKLKNKQMAGIGVVIPGNVDDEHRASVSESGVFKSRVEIADILEEELGLKVRVENNVRAFAMAELLYGKESNPGNVLFVKWGPGVGSVMAVDGSLYEGNRGMTSGLGGMVISKNLLPLGDEPAGCRLSELVSDSAIMRSIAENDNHDMAAVMTEAAKPFAKALTNALILFAPDRVVLSGKFFKDNNLRLTLYGEMIALAPELESVGIEYSAFADREDYIGACAAFSEEHIFR